jgi:hypothetical protein
MDKIIKMFSNIQGSPKTTIFGALVVLFSGFLFLTSDDSITTNSIEFILFTLVFISFLKQIMKTLRLSFILVLFLFSCSKEVRVKKRALRKIEQAKRLAPELFTVDTIKIIDTVVVERFTIDTVTTFYYHDTITVVNNERLLLKYFYDTLRQEIHHEAQCKDVEKIIEHSVPIEVIRGLNLWEHIRFNILPSILLILVLIGVIYTFRR